MIYYHKRVYKKNLRTEEVKKSTPKNIRKNVPFNLTTIFRGKSRIPGRNLDVELCCCLRMQVAVLTGSYSGAIQLFST